MRKDSKTILIVICLVTVCVLILFSPLFRLHNLQITGNKALSEEIIKQYIGLTRPVNILFFNTRTAAKNLKKNQYIDTVIIKKILPNSIAVTIQERRVCGYVPYIDSFLFIDRDGRVVHIDKSPKENLPVITGLNYSGFVLGEILDSTNKEAFNIISVLAQLFEKYNFNSDIINKIDVSDENDIHLFIYFIDIEFGNIKDADEKIRTIKEIIFNKLPNAHQLRGALNIREIGTRYIFKALT